MAPEEVYNLIAVELRIEGGQLLADDKVVNCEFRWERSCAERSRVTLSRSSGAEQKEVVGRHLLVQQLGRVQPAPGKNVGVRLSSANIVKIEDQRGNAHMLRSESQRLVAFFVLLLVTFLPGQACTQNDSPGAAPAVEQTAEQNPDPLRVMSYNIRYNNPEDGMNAWPNRKDKVAQMIGSRHQADLAGLQEALKGQIDDLAARLPDYDWIGVGREDGMDEGEFSPIFYRRDRFELLDSETFWLSETPEVPGSRSWDAAITRIVTGGLFQDRRTEREFYHFNTHFDHRGEQARIESAKILLHKVMELPPETPVIVTGDFNFRDSTEGYQILIGDHSAFEIRSDLKDARYTSSTGHRGPTTTSNNWLELRPDTRIDYIFVRGGIEVLSHRALDDRYEGRFPSDHLPVLAEIELPAVNDDIAE